MLSLRTCKRILFLDSLQPSTEATGSGWSVTHDCFLLSANIPTIFPSNAADGFLIRLQISRLLKPLYIPHSNSFFMGASSQLLHFPPSHFSSYASTLTFVLSTLSDLGIPASDPNPLASIIFSFAKCHYISATTSPIPLCISFNSTTVLRNQAEAADWINGGAPDSQVVRSLRMTSESLKRLKDKSLDGSCLKKSCGKEEEEEKCMVCLEGFEEENKTKHSISRLPCSHVFHFQCVSEWLSLDHRCPVCRFPMPWVHAYFPYVDTAVDMTYPSSPIFVATSYFDLNEDDDSHNCTDDSYPSSDTTESSWILTKLRCFLKNVVQNILRR